VSVVDSQQLVHGPADIAPPPKDIVIHRVLTNALG
jgi:hypothetical protein